MTGKLRMALQTFSVQPLSELSAVEIMGQESMRGQSLEQIEQLRLIDRQLRGSHEELLAMARDTSKWTAEGSDARKQQVKDYGAFIDEQGRLMAGTVTDSGVVVGREIGGSFDEFVLAQRSLVDATEGAISEDQATAKDIASNTEDIAKLLEAGTNQLLGWIGEAVLGIWAKLTGSESAVEALRESQASIERIAGEIAESGAVTRRLEHEKAVATDPAKLRELEAQIAAEEAKVQAKSIEAAVEGALQQELRTGAGSRDEALLRAFEGGGLEEVLSP